MPCPWRVQAPAANHKDSRDAMRDTFVLSNICPQVGDGFNRCTNRLTLSVLLRSSQGMAR